MCERERGSKSVCMGACEYSQVCEYGRMSVSVSARLCMCLSIHMGVYVCEAAVQAIFTAPTSNQKPSPEKSFHQFFSSSARSTTLPVQNNSN